MSGEAELAELSIDYHSLYDSSSKRIMSLEKLATDLLTYILSVETVVGKRERDVLNARANALGITARTHDLRGA